MRHVLTRCVWAATAFAALTVGSFHAETQRMSTDGRMSFHNRLLLNRAVLGGLESIEVLLLLAGEEAREQRTKAVSDRLTQLGGRVLRTETVVGYLRVEVPTHRLLDLVNAPDVEAYQISSLSRGAWYRDGPPASNAQMFRGFEVTPITVTPPRRSYADLPLLTAAEARAPGLTADDAGVGEWMKLHETFDGRGVTIALLESALPSFTDSTLRSAKTIDGRDIDKIAGILNAVDPTYADETRVLLNTRIDAPKSWARVGNRTYILPRAGAFRFGIFDVPAGGNVIHQFAVVEHEATGDIWIDSNGDASFQDETPLADVNERFDPRILKVTYPGRLDVSFVMGRGGQPHVVHIYVGKGSHQAMTVSVAAGSRTDDGLAYGVAPNARVLLVRMYSTDTGLGKTFEAFIETAKRPDVDVISVSAGITIVPDTAADFAGAFFNRLVRAFGKPVINGAGNTSQELRTAAAFGDMLSVGGVLSPANHAALQGGRPVDRLIVHPVSAAGPALDGAIKPDFLTPMERLAADLPWNSGIAAVPKSAPVYRIPPGYQISCCTSATSPYAAGVAALLISAARQSNVPYSAERLSRALRMSARPVEGYQAHEQGNGAIDVGAAWRALRDDLEPPRIVSSADIVHPLAQYAAGGPIGVGILEFEGWIPGMKGVREINLRRESGPPQPITYRVSWTANDGSFSAAPTITLPLNKSVPLPIIVDVRTPGTHSGLVNLHDSVTGTIVHRSQATIVAAERTDPATRTVRVRGRVGLLRHGFHYFHVPPGTAAVAFELEVHTGVLQPTILQSHGLSGDYYMQVHPMNTFHVGPGKYNVVMPNPEPGTWTLRLTNASIRFNGRPELGPQDSADAEYTITVRMLASTITARPAGKRGALVDIGNTGSLIGEPVLEAWSGSLKTHRGSYSTNGLPNVVEINVPRDAASLFLQLRSEQKGPNAELFLYDCTTGECFSYDIGFPAAASQTFTVRKPAPGRWVAAVNVAPFAAAAGSFVIEELITQGTPVRSGSAASRAPGSRWKEVITNLPTARAVEGSTPVVLFQLLDIAGERGEAEHPWSTAKHYVKLRDRPVALGKAIYRR